MSSWSIRWDKRHYEFCGKPVERSIAYVRRFIGQWAWKNFRIKVVCETARIRKVADIQINRVSGKMIPDVTIKEDSIDSPKTNTLLKSEKKLADTDVSSMPGNYYSVFVNDGKYGCEFHGSLLDRYRTHPVFVPITDESYHYTVMLPQNNHWINKDFSYEKSYDFGSVKINYTFQQDKVEITRELKLNTNAIDLKQYKKFRAMMIEWELERPLIFERQRN